MITYTLSGKSDGKGRNGYFKMAEVEAWRPTLGPELDGQVAYIDIFSKRRSGNCGPLRMQLVPEDVKVLAEMFNDLVEELESGEKG